MPELPEVTTVIRTLKNLILNDTIVDVDIKWDNIIDKIEVADFKKQIAGQQIRDIQRKGKLILFMLDDYVMLSHLRMEGKYYVDEEYTNSKHSHVIFKLASNRYLRYHDTRKFGKISLIDKDLYLQHAFLEKIGPEPFDIEVSDLYHKLMKKNIEIKAALLDQSIMAGLGNIYVDEVLFLSQLHPTRKANTLSQDDVQNIIDNSISVLNKAIDLGGTTIRSYTSSLGVSGKFQNELNVHMQKDKACPVCQDTIIKIQVKGRGTYLCPTCQKPLSE